jgi:hypothetical protein
VTNYTSIVILCEASEAFEIIIHEQLSFHFESEVRSFNVKSGAYDKFNYVHTHCYAHCMISIAD